MEFKKYSFIVMFMFFLTLMSSCVSNQEKNLLESKDYMLENKNSQSSVEDQNNTQEKILISDTTESDTSSSESMLIDSIRFENSLENIRIKTIQSPSVPTKGNAFNKDFIFQVFDTEDKAVSNYPISLRFPIGKDNDDIVFSEIKINTDENGILEFSPKETGFSCNSFLYLYPSFEFNSNNNENEINKINELIKTKAYKIPFQIKTNLINAGGSICLADYDKNNTVISTNGYSTSALLGSLIRSGFTGVGNLEFYKEIDGGNRENLLQKVKNLTGSVSTYFIYGTVKYANSPVINEDKIYEVSLNCEIFCILLKTNEELYHTKISITGFGNTETAALNDARNNKMNSLLTEKIIFGM